jgi:surfeit locus 1 family protein
MRKFPLAARALTLCGVGVLCTLGTWQLQRLEWKANILKKLDTAYSETVSTGLDVKALGTQDFIYGRIGGKFLADKALLLGYRIQHEKPGADLIVPLETKQGTVLVDMGFASGSLESQPIHHLNGKQVWFDGLARKPSWNPFTPENIPAKNVWYRADINQIAGEKNLKNPAPVIFYAERASHKFDATFPNNERFAPNNNHLQYALFWYFLALALLAIYVLRFWGKSVNP